MLTPKGLPDAVKIPCPSQGSRVLLLLMILLQITYKECGGNEGAVFRQDENIKGFRLANHLIRKVIALSVIECSLECLRESCCKSTNYKEAVLTNMEENCELNHAAASDQQGDLVRDEGFLHFEMLYPNEGSDVCCSSSSGCQNRGIGHTKEAPGMTCKHIKEHNHNSPSGKYWIQPSKVHDAFQVYCDMKTEKGGWTLVYSYTFTNYGNFYHGSNAVTPRPNWPANQSNVNISETVPLNELTPGAINFTLWKDIGEEEFMIKSNICDWFVCKSIKDGGSIVQAKKGSIACRNIKQVVMCNNSSDEPTEIKWNGYGPRVDGSSVIVRFDGSTSEAFPTHDPCKGNGTERRNHKKGVLDPAGAIYLR